MATLKVLVLTYGTFYKRNDIAAKLYRSAILTPPFCSLIIFSSSVVPGIGSIFITQYLLIAYLRLLVKLLTAIVNQQLREQLPGLVCYLLLLLPLSAMSHYYQPNSNFSGNGYRWQHFFTLNPYRAQPGYIGNRIWCGTCRPSSIPGLRLSPYTKLLERPHRSTCLASPLYTKRCLRQELHVDAGQRFKQVRFNPLIHRFISAHIAPCMPKWRHGHIFLVKCGRFYRVVLYSAPLVCI